MGIDRSKHKPAARSDADFPPCEIPARPFSVEPGYWTCRCWSCSAWIGHETAHLAAEPWRYHVCRACWESLSVNQRIELAFRLSAACEGGLGAPQAVTQVVAKLAEVSDQIVATCRGFNVWLTEAMDLWRAEMTRQQVETDRLLAAEEGESEADRDEDDPNGGEPNEPDWWKRRKKGKP